MCSKLKSPRQKNKQGKNTGLCLPALWALHHPMIMPQLGRCQGIFNLAVQELQNLAALFVMFHLFLFPNANANLWRIMYLLNKNFAWRYILREQLINTHFFKTHTWLKSYYQGGLAPIERFSFCLKVKSPKSFKNLKTWPNTYVLFQGKMICLNQRTEGTEQRKLMWLGLQVFLRQRDRVMPGKVIGHLTDLEGKLKLSRSSGPLMAVVNPCYCSPTPKRPLCPQRTSIWPRQSPQHLHEDWQLDRQMAHILTAQTPSPAASLIVISTFRKDAKMSLRGNKGKKRERNTLS